MKDTDFDVDFEFLISPKKNYNKVTTIWFHEGIWNNLKKSMIENKKYNSEDISIIILKIKESIRPSYVSE